MFDNNDNSSYEYLKLHNRLKEKESQILSLNLELDN